MDKVFKTCDCGCQIKGNTNHGKIFFLCLDCGYYEEVKVTVETNIEVKELQVA